MNTASSYPAIPPSEAYSDSLQLIGTRRDTDATSNNPMDKGILNTTGLSADTLYDQIVFMGSYDTSPPAISHQRIATNVAPVVEDNNVLTSFDHSKTNLSGGAMNMDSMDLFSDQILNQNCFPSTGSGHSGDVDWSLGDQNLPHTGSGSSSIYLSSPPNGLDNPIIHGDTEDQQLMFYLDHVFHLHCPFYSFSSRQGRGWLLSILKRASSAYHAALALSEYHLSTATQHGGGAYQVGKSGSHYDLALRELEINLTRSSTWGGQIRHVIELLTTITHLLWYESYNGGKIDWQTHLAEASTLLPVLVQAQNESVPAWEDQTNDHQERGGSFPDTSVSFLLAFFIHAHIITCASTRSSQFLIPDHRNLLEKGRINLRDLMGSSNRVMISIFDIASLLKWKKAESDAHRLSLIELAKRGSQIGERLQAQLASVEHTLGQNRHLRNKSSLDTKTCSSESIKNEITRIFALAALTYLHVAISGPHPDIPDIKINVSKTIEALKDLPDPKFFPIVVWPYCVAGCLAADKKQQKVLRELVTLQGITHGACLEALSLMEECWRLREAETSSLDWTVIMERRGYDSLLI
ncbi:fungal-specific transcription factor domain-containing protein [Pestalotiopsis sp. NC0098]|nr:fungal-specific transcription factor domain-containing protein [Pestalotiopsis sp. NC0098]